MISEEQLKEQEVYRKYYKQINNPNLPNRKIELLPPLAREMWIEQHRKDIPLADIHQYVSDFFVKHFRKDRK